MKVLTTHPLVPAQSVFLRVLSKINSAKQLSLSVERN